MTDQTRRAPFGFYCEQFPMTVFDLKMDRIRFIAGNAAICAKLRTVLEL